ncbi:MAG: dihydrodipicolinate synthase family protein [Acidobacteria bacterium]|nr:dihydrodipicolinate synthase family protein [Acidobacteriota bacterium]
MTRKEVHSKIKGIFVPAVTPFNPRGEIDLNAFRHNLRRYAKNGVSGVIVLGSSGEATYLTEAEKLRLIEAARDIVRPPQLLLAGTGLESTRLTIELSRQAIGLGVDALLVLTPAYYKSRMDAAALATHYQAVADALRRPILIYSIPQFTGINMEAATIARLSKHENIAGLKESSGKMEFLQEILRRSHPKFCVLTGSPLILLEALQAGAAGGVLGPANYVPELYVKIYDCFCRGEMEAGRKLQQQLEPAVREVSIRCGIAGVKYAADLCGYRAGAPRAPLLPLRQAEQRAIAAALRKAQVSSNHRGAA